MNLCSIWSKRRPFHKAVGAYYDASIIYDKNRIHGEVAYLFCLLLHCPPVGCLAGGECRRH